MESNFSDVIHNEDLAIGTFRRSVSQVIPEMTRVALLNRRQEIVKDTPSAAKKKYLYYLSRSKYEREWGTEYRHPRLGARILAFFLRIVPKVGPFSALDFKIPPPKAEDLFVKSVDDTVREYGGLLSEARAGTLNLSDKDSIRARDEGGRVRAGGQNLCEPVEQCFGPRFQNGDARVAGEHSRVLRQPQCAAGHQTQAEKSGRSCSRTWIG